MSSGTREKQTKEEIAEAKNQATEAQSIFEAQPAVFKKSVKERRVHIPTSKKTCDKLVRMKEVSPRFHFLVLFRFNRIPAQIFDG